MAKVDYFLKVDGIDGESGDSKHKGEIDVHGFNFGARNAGTFGSGGGGGAGKSYMEDFAFTMRTGKAAPKLMLACATGEHIKKAVFVARKAGKDQQEYLKVTMSDILVSSYNTRASGGDDPIPYDEILLNFGKIEFEYKEQKADGTLGGSVKTGWDAEKNKAV